MARLGDQHPLRSKHAHALVEDDLDQARVWQVDELRSDAFGLVTRFNGGEVRSLPSDFDTTFWATTSTSAAFSVP